MGLLGYIRVSRPPLLFLGLIASLGLLSWSGLIIHEPVRACLVVLTIFSANWGWNLINELFDKTADSVNKPWKPIPSGQVMEDNVAGLAFTLIFLSFFINVWLFFHYDYIYAIGGLAHLTSLTYNALRKDLWGNLSMTATYGLAAFISLYPNNLLFALGFALLTLAFNCNTQFQDRKADRAAGVRTLPLQLGNMETYRLTVVSSFLAAVIFTVIYSTTFYEPLLIFIVIMVFAIVSASSMVLSETNEKRADLLIENLIRRLGRILLIIGFLWMILDRFI